MWPFKNILYRTDKLNKVVYLNNNSQWPRQLLTKPSLRLWVDWYKLAGRLSVCPVLTSLWRHSRRLQDGDQARWDDLVEGAGVRSAVRPLRLTETLFRRDKTVCIILYYSALVSLNLQTPLVTQSALLQLIIWPPQVIRFIKFINLYFIFENPVFKNKFYQICIKHSNYYR